MKDELKTKVKGLITLLSEMTEDQREALALKLNIMNPEGHILSTRNQVLLFNQSDMLEMETPTIVAGFRQWIKNGRCVIKGQKGMLIAVPSKKNKPDEATNPEEEPDIFFLWKYVFNVSQTQEIPEEEYISTVKDSAHSQAATA